MRNIVRVSSHRQRSLALQFASFGGFVRKTATSRGIEHTRESLQAIGEDLEASDPVKFCCAVLDDAGWHPGESAVVDGIRHVRIWETIKNIVAPQPIYLVYLEAPEELRRARLQERGAKEANYLAKAEAHSTEQDVIAELPQLADLVSRPTGRMRRI